MDSSTNDEDFSSDPLENLRIQNELLKLKMQAELGAEFGGDMSELPPEVVRQVLEQLMRFHEAQSKGEVSTVGQQLGQEDWPRAETFSDESSLIEAWNDLQDRLTRARLHVGFLAEYPLSQKWDFITQELMKKETLPLSALDELQFGGQFSGQGDEPAGEGLEGDDPVADDEGDGGEDGFENPVALTGMGFMGFIYEEYHPNHAYSIEGRVQELLNNFFGNSFAQSAPELSPTLIAESGSQLTIDEFREKVERFHDLFSGGIREWEFAPHSTVWDTPLDDAQKPIGGTGRVDGELRFVAITDDGEESEVVGPFSAQLEYRDDSWKIFSFSLHGFSWA